jgi:hypothetical protein
MDPDPDSYRDSREICRNRFGSRLIVDNGAAKIGVCVQMAERRRKEIFTVERRWMILARVTPIAPAFIRW